MIINIGNIIQRQCCIKGRISRHSITGSQRNQVHVKKILFEVWLKKQVVEDDEKFKILFARVCEPFVKTKSEFTPTSLMLYINENKGFVAWIVYEVIFAGAKVNILPV